MWNHRTRRAVLIVCSMLAFAPCGAQAETTTTTPTIASTPAIGEDEGLYRCKSRNADVVISFKPEVELKELMTWVTGFTCKNFILDPRVVVTGKKITVIAPNKMTASEAYRLFLVSLSTMSLTVVPKGNILRITDSGAARRDTVPILKKGMPDSGEQVVRYILRPTYSTPEVLMPALATLKSETGDVQLVGTLIMITDYTGNVRDMLSLVKLVDVAKGSEGIYTIPVQHADATKLSEKIKGILGIDAAPTPARPAAPGMPAVATAATANVPSKVMVDERTNTLIVASSEAGYQRFRALVERLDIALDIEGGASIHVYRLGSAIAEELAKTLNDAVSSQPQAQAHPAPGAAPALPASPAEALGSAIEGQVKVIADKPTNSLIVVATGRDFLAIKEVIALLDLPRRQVYIEALIVEVSVGDGLSLGTTAHGAVPVGDGGFAIGGVQAPDLKSFDMLSALGDSSGLIGGLLGKSTTILGKTIPSYAVLFTAIADKSNSNVLSAPSITALDNETAKFKVGQRVPYKKGLSFGGFTGTEPTGSANVNIDREDLNLELEIKPHISIDDTILLEIKHDAKELGDFDKLLQEFRWNTRSFETRLLARDQQTVVIGGLMQERETVSTTQVPLLGDIPIIGYLFKQTTKRKTKSNLLIMLTPYIIKDQLDVQAIKERKQRDHAEFVGSFRALESMKFQPKIDYSRKRGVVEEINRAVQGVEEDLAVKNAMRRPPAVPGGAIELPEE